ncbi:MAG: M48 family metalloprotease [Planctomycetota bacterium]
MKRAPGPAAGGALRRRRTRSSFGFSIFGFALALPLLLGGCCTDPVNGERYFCLGEVSDAEEARIGERYAASFIAQSGGIYPDPQLESYLGGIVIEQMANRSHRPHLPWEFHILNSSDVNAFALPGGKVFVTRGLLGHLQNEAQFAHLMGHEIGHVSHRHSVRGQGRAALFALLLGVVTEVEGELLDDPDDPPLLSAAAGIAGQLTLLKFSRDQELQSDRRGVDYALQAGYDPREGRRTFQTFLELKEGSGRGSTWIDGLLSTHPLDRRRIDQLDEYIETEYPSLPAPGGKLVVTSGRWEAHTKRLRAAQRVYERHDRALTLIRAAHEGGDQAGLDEAEALLRECARALPRHASFPLALGILHLERHDTGSALPHLDRACALDGSLFGGRFARSRARLLAGMLGPAGEDLRVAHDLFPLSPHPCFLLGETQERLGEPSEAARWYRAVLERAPRDSALYRRAEERLRGHSAAS